MQSWHSHWTPASKHQPRSKRATCNKICLVHDLSRQLTAYEQVLHLVAQCPSQELVSNSSAAHMTATRPNTQLLAQARAWQHCLVDHVLAAAIDSSEQDRACLVDTGRLLLVQHLPVYTLGAGSSLSHIHFSLQQPPHPLYRTERGGEVTYHGPGQLVLYPIINLRHFQPDLHWYLRNLEEVVIRSALLT